MRNTKPFLLLFCLLFATTSFAQSAIYYDKDWKETTKEKHEYYRPLPLKKVGELIYIQDYYKNGQLQYQGYSYADDENARVGDVFWYTEDGYDSSTYSYENFTNTKELTYYYTGGKEWKKILYNKRGEKQLETTYIEGKKPIVGEYYNEEYFGTFNVSRFTQDYASLKRNRSINKDSISLKNQKKYLPTDSKDYSEIIYWSNGNKAKEALYTKAKYNTNKKTTYYTEKGVVINQIENEYNAPIGSSYYRYYTKFGIAQGIKSKTEMLPKDHKWKEEKTTYYPNGKIKEIKKSTWENSEIQSFDLKGKVTIQKIKERAPFDGSFTDTISNKVTYFQMLEGKRIGEVITKNYESDTIVAKGVYKDNKPFDGTFYFHDKKAKLLQYKNGLQEGVQKEFSNYYADKPIEVYEMKKGERDGFKKTYKDDVLISEELYRNNLPVNGTIVENNTKKIYKNAQLSTIEYYKESYSNELSQLQYVEYYDNDVLTKIESFNFRIAQDIKRVYTGIYKNSKPFSGYFISENTTIDKNFIVDYYENGVLLHQYSYDFISQMDTFNIPVYDEKTVYKDGKVTDGYRYIKDEDSRGFYLKLKYANSEITMIELNLFAVHYFNRISYELKDDALYVKDFSSPAYVKISNNKQYLIAEMYNEQGKVPAKKQAEIKDKTPNSLKTSYIINNVLESYSSLPFSEEYYDSVNKEKNSVLISQLYYNFPKYMISTPKEYFSNYVKLIDIVTNKDKKEDEDDMESFFAQLVQGATSNSSSIAELLYDDNGKQYQGIDVKLINNQYKVDFYFDGKLLKTSYYQTTKELQDQSLYKTFIELAKKQL